MSRYQPTTPTGNAVRELVDEMLSTVRLPGMLAAAMPLVHRELDKVIAGIDADPDAARARLRPLAAKVVTALGFTGADLDSESDEAA